MIYETLKSCQNISNCSIEIFGAVFALTTIRYIIFSGLFFLIFWVFLRKKIYHRYIQKKFPPKKKILNEFKWSISTFIVFGFIGMAIFQMRQNGITMMYDNISDRGLPYFILSILILIILHDFYFYLGHKFMHLKKIYKYVHKVHHQSTNPSPWAAFSFHPLEAIIEGGIVPLAIVMMPLHIGAVGIFLLYMTFFNVFGHLGFEILPKNFVRHWFFQIYNTPTHHNMHHSKVHCNYSLYFNIWDKIFKTNHKDYFATFDEITNRKAKDFKKKNKPLTELDPHYKK